MNKLTYRVYVTENLSDGKWSPTRLSVTIFRDSLRDLSGFVDMDEYRIRRVNSEEEMCRIIDIGIQVDNVTLRLTSDPSQLEWVS